MNSPSQTDSIIRAVLRECHERLVDELQDDQITQVLHSKGFISKEAKKSILSAKKQDCRIKELLRKLEDSNNDDALDALIKHLRDEGTQPHLWTLLEYSRVKHRRIRADNMIVPEDLHM